MSPKLWHGAQRKSPSPRSPPCAHVARVAHTWRASPRSHGLGGVSVSVLCVLGWLYWVAGGRQSDSPGDSQTRYSNNNKSRGLSRAISGRATAPGPPAARARARASRSTRQPRPLPLTTEPDPQRHSLSERPTDDSRDAEHAGSSHAGRGRGALELRHRRHGGVEGSTLVRSRRCGAAAHKGSGSSGEAPRPAARPCARYTLRAAAARAAPSARPSPAARGMAWRAWISPPRHRRQRPTHSHSAPLTGTPPPLPLARAARRTGRRPRRAT